MRDYVSFPKDTDPAFHGAGAKPGLEIWCIESPQVVPVPKSSHGKFYSRCSYIILNTVIPKNEIPQHDIHYWLGEDTNQEDSTLASDKALELDEVLGSCTVQYRELQGHETEKFLAYFKPCIIPLQGVHSSQNGHFTNEKYQIKLLTCKGDHVVHVTEVPFSRSSLNHNDVFILDTALKIFLFSGCNSSTQERAKGLEVVEYIKENKHGGSCDVATVEDGKFVGDLDVGEFWSFFGGYAPIPKDTPSVPKKPDSSSVKLFWINLVGKLLERGNGILKKELLETDKCYMLDCNLEIFVWMGRHTSVSERKTSISAAEEFLRNQERSSGTHLTFLTEGLETASFRTYFDEWPTTVEPKLYEEGRGKVAAIFKHQGYEVKELPEEEDYQPSIDTGGKLKVWLVNGDELSTVPVQGQIQLFSGDCYILQYTYPGNGKEENLFYAWLGRTSTTEDRKDAISHLNSIADKTKGNPVLAQVLENKEPLQFFFIVKVLIIFKGGKSARYKNLVEEKGIDDDTYYENKTTLFRVQGTNPNNMQAIQVDLVPSSLNSSYCYILQSETSVFSWIGSLSLARDHDILDRMIKSINPTWQRISVREGNEPDIFWDPLGGKAEYPKGKEISGHVEDPHLFVLNINEGDFKVKEIFNFTQDDLTTEDVLVLDCHNEIYVWIGCHSNVGSKQQAISLGQKFLETEVRVEGTSLEIPIYVVTEGHEPPFFTRFFTWDFSKAHMHGNSFDRKLAIIKGKLQNTEAPFRNSPKSSISRPETTPDSFRERSLSPLTTSPPARKLFTESPPSDNAEKYDLPLTYYPYERLKVDSKDPVRDIDVTKREAYLSEEEFEERVGMKRGAFYKLPKWKQNKLKMSLHLF